jgi:hypothetical protein
VELWTAPTVSDDVNLERHLWRSTMMMHHEDELRLVEERNHEIRKQAGLHRLVEAAHSPSTSRFGLIARLRALVRPGNVDVSVGQASTHAVQRALAS